MYYRLSVLTVLILVCLFPAVLPLVLKAENTFIECTGARYIGCETGTVSAQTDFPVFTIELTFSEPVTVKKAENIWLRYSAENGRNQIKPKNGEASVTYIDPEIISGENYSDTVRICFDGYTSAKSGEVNVEFFLNGYSIIFTEYDDGNADDGISTAIIHGKNGKPLKHTVTNGEGLDFTIVDFSSDIAERSGDKKCVLKKVIRASDRIFALEFTEPIMIYEGDTPFFGIRLVDDAGNVMKSGDAYLQYFNGTWEYYDENTKNVILWIADDGATVSDILEKKGDYSAPELAKYQARFCIEEKPSCGYDTHDGTLSGILGTETITLLRATNISGGRGYDRILRMAVTDYSYELPERYAGENDTKRNADDDPYGGGIIMTTEKNGEQTDVSYTVPLIITIAAIVAAGAFACAVIIRRNSGERKK